MCELFICEVSKITSMQYVEFIFHKDGCAVKAVIMLVNTDISFRAVYCIGHSAQSATVTLAKHQLQQNRTSNHKSVIHLYTCVAFIS